MKLEAQYKRSRLGRWFGEEPLVIGKCARNELPFTVVEVPSGSHLPFDKAKDPTLRIGGGSFGCVYKGTMTERRPNPDPTIRRSERRMNWPVAVKFVRCTFVDEMERQRVHQQFATHSAWIGFDYPSISRFLSMDMGSFAAEGFWALVSDCALSDNLRVTARRWLDVGECVQGRPKTPRGVVFDDTAAVCCALGLSCAIAYLHFLGFVHRDIKPANVLLTEEMRPALTDFGLIVRISDPSLQMTGTGTPCYMPPEARSRARRFTITEKFDVYSLGLVLSFLFTGMDPEDAGFRDPWEAVLDPELANLVKGCLEPDPRVRWDIVRVIRVLQRPELFFYWSDMQNDSKREAFVADFEEYKKVLFTPDFREALDTFKSTPIEVFS